MPRPRKPARVVTCKDRPGLFAYLSRDEPHVALNTSDQAEAQVRLAELLHARRLREVAPDDRPIAECFGEHLLRSKTNHAPKTLYEHGLNGRRVLAWLETMEVSSARQVTRELIEDYKTVRRFDKVSPARINAELNTWKGALKIAAEWELIPEAALRSFVKLKEPRPVPHQVGLTKAELARFIKAERHPGYRAFWRVVLGTGMRDAELRHMSPSDVLRRDITVTPKDGWNPKNYWYRTIPVSAATTKAAKAFLAAKPTLPMDKKTVWLRLQATREAAKIAKHFSLHDLRRSWASHMLNAGFKIEIISKYLGHGDIMTTMRYLRIVTDDAIDRKRLPF